MPSGVSAPFAVGPGPGDVLKAIKALRTPGPPQYRVLRAVGYLVVGTLVSTKTTPHTGPRDPRDNRYKRNFDAAKWVRDAIAVVPPDPPDTSQPGGEPMPMKMWARDP